MTLTHMCRSRCRAACWTAVAWCAAVLLDTSGAAHADSAIRPLPAASRARAMVDPAVVPAGGLHCRQCGPAAGPLHRGHMAECRDGVCTPHCPVRPGTHGYYGTQWRRWPGEGVVRTSAEEAVTPAPPAKSQVPTVEEESPQALVDEPAAPAPDAEADVTPPTPAPPATPRDERTREPAADALQTDPVPEDPPAAEPSTPAREQAVPPVPPVPPGDAPVPPAADADLFDQSAVPPVDDAEPIEQASMRYPAPVGRSLTKGADPWRLDPARRQRSDASARGL